MKKKGERWLRGLGGFKGIKKKWRNERMKPDDLTGLGDLCRSEGRRKKMKNEGMNTPTMQSVLICKVWVNLKNKESASGRTGIEQGMKNQPVVWQALIGSQT